MTVCQWPGCGPAMAGRLESETVRRLHVGAGVVAICVSQVRGSRRAGPVGRTQFRQWMDDRRRDSRGSPGRDRAWGGSGSVIAAGALFLGRLPALVGVVGRLYVPSGLLLWLPAA